MEKSLTEMAHETLRELVLSCELAPGERVTERLMVQRTGFGKTPVREALVRLADEGLVRASPRSGYLVTPITLADVDEMFEAAILVVPPVLRLAVRRDHVQVRDALERAKSRLPQDNATAAEELFHGIARATGNSRIVDLQLRLFTHLRRVFALAYRTSGPAGWLIEGIEAMAGSAGDGDGESAAEQAQRVLRLSHEDSVRLLSSRESIRSAHISV